MAEEKKTNINLKEMDDDSPVIKEAIKKLQTLIQEEEGLNLRTDDLFMRRHLYGSNLDAEEAFRKIQEFYKMKIEYPDWFVTKSVKEYKSVMDLHTHYILPERDSKGRRVFLVKMGNIDTSKMKVEEMAVLDELFLEAILDEPETLKNGTLTITDMAGYSYKNLAWLMPSNMNIASRKGQGVTVQDTHEHHIVNTSMLMNAALHLIFPFINKATKDHVYFHYSNYEDLHKHVNPEILPEEYKGTGPPVDYDAVYERFIYSQENKFQELIQQGYAA